jgi:hypothetical protein
MLKGLIWGMLCVFLLLGPAPACAADNPPGPPEQGAPGTEKQESSEQVQLPKTTTPIITDVALTQAYKSFTLQIYPTLNLTGGVFNSNWQQRSVGTGQANATREIVARGDYKSLAIPIILFYGVTPRMDISLSGSFEQNWASNVEPASRAANFGSLGDTGIHMRYRFLDENPAATIVAGYFAVLFPTGHASPLEPKLFGIDQTGGGAFSFTWGIDLFRYVPQVPVLLYANIYYTNFTNGWVKGTRVIYPDQITVNLAMEVPFKKSPDNRWAFLLETLSLWDAGRMLGPKANQAPLAIVSVLPALEFLPCSWFSLAAGVQVPIFGKNTTYNYAPTISFFITF